MVSAAGKDRPEKALLQGGSAAFGSKAEKRARGVRMVLSGKTQARVARELGVSRQAVHRWMKAYREGGTRALKTGRRGRMKEQVLQPWQEAQVVAAITLVPPEHLGLPHRCWTREAIRRLVSIRFGITLSEWMVRSYLQRWGIPSQKQARGLFRRTPARLLEWIDARQFGLSPEGKAAESRGALRSNRQAKAGMQKGGDTL